MGFPKLHTFLSLLGVDRWQRCVAFIFLLIILQIAYFTLRTSVLRERRVIASTIRFSRLPRDGGQEVNASSLGKMATKQAIRNVVSPQEVKASSFVEMATKELLQNVESPQEVKTSTLVKMATKEPLPNALCPQIFDSVESNHSRYEKRLFRKRRSRDFLAFGQLKTKSNCTYFKRDRGYFMLNGTVEEEQFPLAYSILIYKEFYQVERLLRAIYRPQNYYCIHYDRKSDEEFKQNVHKLASCFDNVFVSSTTTAVEWGRFSVLEAELYCMKDLLTKPRWKYFINLTGQEFPLKTNWQIARILKAYDGANDVGGSIKLREKKRYKNKDPAPYNITLVKGPVHAVLSRAFIEFIFSDEKALEFLHWTNGTWIPDETFFASLQHSPHLGVPGAWNGTHEEMEVKESMARYKLWKPAPCEGKRVRQICIFNKRDLPPMKDAPQLFANKFHFNYGELAYECLDELHWNRTRDEYLHGSTLNVSFYENLSLVKYSVNRHLNTQEFSSDIEEGSTKPGTLPDKDNE